MNLFLHIIVSSANLNFNKPPVNIVGLHHYDVDNFSDAITIDTGVQALQRSEKIFLLIEAKDKVALGGISKLLNHIGKLKIPYQIAYNGKHQMLDKMMLRFKKHTVHDLSPPQIEEACQAFFSHSQNL